VAPAAPGAAAAPSGYPDLAPGESRKLYGEIPFEIELEPTCATVGTVMRAAIRTVPDALVGGAVRYSDGQPHGDYSWGRTPTGDWVWTWTIKPDVPTGKADAMVTGGNSESGGGAAMATFVVADRC
jgi:hypothetical protein